ncbi:hypothetical protein BKH46_00245 [Helicobacter sp. 12S02634-8]|uniref:DUF1090 family protein n=1 Tax=Helicobacter sp. 12S02634-8 TaxID=1476199 RepID=UPI000BA6D536|nr:DUF1090 family protein [Helicobacter sp. 12S02634-8]PAF48380.1 hypothetical protein BKH46_00245 [Helicobacter sp. 12S02634-8]
MQKILIVPMIFAAFVYGGAICDFKIKDLQTQIQDAQNKAHTQRAAELIKKLEAFKKDCKDSDILADIHHNIEVTQNQYKQAKAHLSQAQSQGDPHAIRQAQIEVKIANMQFVAAQQELLRMKDLLKNP